MPRKSTTDHASDTVVIDTTHRRGSGQKSVGVCSSSACTNREQRRVTSQSRARYTNKLSLPVDSALLIGRGLRLRDIEDADQPQLHLLCRQHHSFIRNRDMISFCLLALNSVHACPTAGGDIFLLTLSKKCSTRVSLMPVSRRVGKGFSNTQRCSH